MYRTVFVDFVFFAFTSHVVTHEVTPPSQLCKRMSNHTYISPFLYTHYWLGQ